MAHWRKRKAAPLTDAGKEEWGGASLNLRGTNCIGLDDKVSYCRHNNFVLDLSLKQLTWGVIEIHMAYINSIVSRFLFYFNYCLCFILFQLFTAGFPLNFNHWKPVVACFPFYCISIDWQILVWAQLERLERHLVT